MIRVTTSQSVISTMRFCKQCGGRYEAVLRYETILGFRNKRISDLGLERSYEVHCSAAFCSDSCEEIHGTLVLLLGTK